MTLPQRPEELATFAIVVLAGLGLFFGGRAIQFWIDRDAAKLKDVRGARENPCPRCGKPVLEGAEEYHRKRCSGWKRSQRSYRIGTGERIDR